MADSQDSTFIINDVVLDIPPSQISIHKANALREIKTLRTRSSMKVRSGKSSLSISLDVFFPDKSSVNNKLRRLVAQFSLTPFCYVENQYLRDSVLGEGDKGQNMALALQNLTISTVPGQPGMLNARFSFVWFNYKPYTPNFLFKNIPFINLPQKQPGSAFQMFYLPQLAKHLPVTFSDSKMTLSQFEFMITANNEVQRNNEVSLDINQRSFDEFKNLLSEFIDTVKSVKKDNEEQDAEELEGFSLDSLSDISLRLGSGDPTVTNVGGVSRALEESARITSFLQDAQIATTTDLNQQKIQQLLLAQRNLLTTSTEIFSNGDIWLEFPVALLGGTNKVGTNNPSKLYFRIRTLEFGRESDGLIVEQISASHGNILALLPMNGYQYPTAQYLGSSDKRFSLRVKILSDNAKRRWTTFMNVYNNNMQFATFIPQMYTNIEVTNELFDFMAVKEIMLEEVQENTVPDSPGLYDMTVDFVERGVRPESAEQIRAIPTHFGEVRRAVWQAIWRNIGIGDRGILVPVSKGAGEAGAREYLNKLISEFITPSVLQMLKHLERSGLVSETSAILNQGPAGGPGRRITKEAVSKVSNNAKTRSLKGIAAVTALTDEEILGVEGLADVMWNWGTVGAESSTIDIFGTNSGALYKGGIDNARQYLRNRKEEIIETNKDRYKKLQSAVQGIEDYKSAVERREDPGEGKLRVLDFEGNLVDLNKVLKDAGLENDFEAKVVAAGEKDALSGLRKYRGGLIGNLIAAVGDASVEDEEQDFIDDYLEKLRDELQELELQFENSLYEDEFINIFYGAKAGGAFRDWPVKARDYADTIIYSSLIDLEMFKEANEILKNMQVSSQGHIYQDIPMAEVQSVVNKALGDKYPVGFRLEPDFYFINETADLNINSFIEENQVEQIKNYSNQYTQDVIENNKNWFKQTYLREVGGGFRKMLVSSSEKQTVGSKYTGLSNSPGMSQMNKPPSILQSLNNATSARSNSAHKKPIGGQHSLNSIPASANAPRAKHTMGKFLDTSVNSTERPNTIISRDGKDLASSDEWVMPLEGDVRITSVPGYRSITDGSAYHPGIDMAVGRPGDIIGQPVYASAEGEVVGIGRPTRIPGPGNNLIIKTVRPSGNYFHRYLHLQDFAPGLSTGDVVSKGQLIGYAGQTGRNKGPHLHFEVRRNSPNGDIVWPFGSYTKREMLENPNKPIIRLPLINWSGDVTPITTVPGIAPSDRGNTILEQSLKSMSKSWNNNAGYRMNRAYPGIYMAFIEEDTPGPMLVFDAFFNYQSIVSCEIVRDREVAADYCRIVLTNISGLLSNRKFEGTYLENKLINNGKEAKRKSNPLQKDLVKESQIESLMLREGMKVEIRMGYSDVPEKLSTTMVGRIVSLQFSETDDIVELEIQSLATELVQDVKGVDKAIKENSILGDSANTGPLLEGLISSPECVSFGFWNRGDRIGNTNRDLLTRRWEWNPRPQTDNIFAPEKAAMNQIDPGLFFDRIEYRIYQMTIWDVFKEMELRHPEYIASPVPYTETNGSRKRMTMFFGLPDQLYFSRDPSLTENRRGEEIKSQREQIKENLLSAYKNGGRILDVAAELLENSSLAKSDRQELLARTRTAFESELYTGTSADLDFKVNARVNELVDAYVESELAKAAIEAGSIQPFRKYHLLTSEMHIVANNLRAKSSSTFNAVTVQYEVPDTLYLPLLSSEGEESQFGLEIDDAETITMKLDPTIPDEDIRENFMIFPNCLGEAMAKNYCVSLLQKGVWQTYSGDLVILGNPDIKPYDICYIHDSYTDMTGPIQVRRATHYFSHETGFITVITPDCVAYASEGTGLTQNQAMALMAEVFLKKSVNLDVNIITPGRTPLDGAQTTPGLYQLAAAGGQLINFFGGKRMLFRTQFDDPIHVVPLFKQGRPMVAGFGPLHLRRNFFATKGFARELKEAMTGLMEGVDDLRLRWDSGLLSESRGRLFGENVVKRK